MASRLQRCTALVTRRPARQARPNPHKSFDVGHLKRGHHPLVRLGQRSEFFRQAREKSAMGCQPREPCQLHRLCPKHEWVGPLDKAAKRLERGHGPQVIRNVLSLAARVGLGDQATFLFEHGM
jgi:hypothetical protein